MNRKANLGVSIPWRESQWLYKRPLCLRFRLSGILGDFDPTTKSTAPSLLSSRIGYKNDDEEPHHSRSGCSCAGCESSGGCLGTM